MGHPRYSAGLARPLANSTMAPPHPFRWLALLALLVACASRRPVAGPIAGEVEPPLPVSSTYLLRPGDELEIRFFHTPEHDVELPVRPDGRISLPLAYEVMAAGRTPEELRAELVERYAQELAAPEIAVIVKTFHTTFPVHVGGEVDKPGVLEISAPKTVLEAIFQAGGFLPTASLANAMIVRRRDDGRTELVPTDLELLLRGQDASGNVYLRPYDVVFVPPSRIADVNKWVDQYIRQNIPISFSYRLDP